MYYVIFFGTDREWAFFKRFATEVEQRSYISGVEDGADYHRSRVAIPVSTQDDVREALHRYAVQDRYSAWNFTEDSFWNGSDKVEIW